jgi:hypothetical protein
MATNSWFAVVRVAPAVHLQACVLWSSDIPILMVDGRRFKRSDLFRSGDTEARHSQGEQATARERPKLPYVGQQ